VEDKRTMPERRRWFGTDGIRGLANREPVTPETMVRIGRALGSICARQGSPRPNVVIGRDTRRSGEMLESALAAGLCSTGVDVLTAGVIPTPGVALLTRSRAMAAGIVVSASHNPFADNGVKIFGADGYKLDDGLELEIERLAVDAATGMSPPTGSGVGRVRPFDEGRQIYQSALQAVLSPTRTLHGLKMVIDCAHGAAHAVGPALFTALGAEVVALGVEPDGENINQGSGALHPEQLAASVRAHGAQMGLAVDGDGDRAIFVDETGTVVDGDEVLAIFGLAMLAAGTLKQRTVVATVMSNLGLEHTLRDRGATLLRTPVGDRHVVEEMRRGGYNLGGEQSGHLVFLDHATTGDGLLAGIRLAALLLESNQPLSRMKTVMTKFPQVMLNVRVARRRALDDMPALRQVTERITADLADQGRVLVRYSGTEPLLRVMVEGRERGEVERYAREIAAVARRDAGPEQ
jgi:phosphoglucosamine mutase